MKARFLIILVCLAAALFLKCTTMVSGQQVYFTDTTETKESIETGEVYLRSRSNAIAKYIRRAEKENAQLLKKLDKKEAAISGILTEKYPEVYIRYNKESLTFDSIRRLSKDTATLYNKGSPQSTGLIDSLKGIQQFINHQSARLSGASGLAGKAGISPDYTQKLNGLQQQLRAQEQINTLIDRRSNYLNNLLSEKDIPALGSLQKDIAIGRSKIQYWKQTACDPDKAEEKALEYLEGTEGFQSYLRQDNPAFGGLGNDAGPADLQRLGFQTKSQVSSMLDAQFGDRLGNIQQQVGKEIAQYPEKLNSIKEKVNEAKSSITEARQIKEQLQHIEKPAFSNPMRGIPFWKRWETQYSFQSSRSTGSRPALLNAGASLAYRQTPKLRTGIGIAADIGMGKDWQHLRLSYEGISLKGFINYDMIYGIALEGGYERIFRPGNRPYLEPVPEQNRPNENGNTALKDLFGAQQQSLYLGLMKRYRINSRWTGTFMIGYNFLWQQYNMKSPLIIRLGWEK